MGEAAGRREAAQPHLDNRPTTAGVADLFNATYEVMLQMLVRFFAHTEVKRNYRR